MFLGAIAINWNRTKLNTSLAKVNNSTLSNPVEGAQVWDLNLRLDAVTLDEVSLGAMSGGTGQPVLTLDAGTFVANSIRVGDLVTGDANIPAGAYVVSFTDNTLTLDQNTTGEVTGSTILLNAGGAKTLGASILQVRLAFVPSVDRITLTPTFYLFDGTKTDDPGNTSLDAPTIPDDVSETITLATQTTPTFQINLDNFLSNLRVARTDA